MENVFDFIIDNSLVEEQIKPSYKERKVTLNVLKNELAFHEASHLVFNCLGLRHLDGFSPLFFIASCAENAHEDSSNVVNGFAPNVPKNLMYRRRNEEPKVLLDFYNEDRKRLVAQLISGVAGYASYQVFMKYKCKEEYFIGCSVIKETSEDYRKLRYYRKEHALYSFSSDFTYIDAKLKTYYELNSQEAVEATIKLIEIVQKLMHIPAVNMSIRFVKNKLLKNQCIKIEGNRLVQMCKEVDRLTNKIQFESILEQYIEKIS